MSDAGVRDSGPSDTGSRSDGKSADATADDGGLAPDAVVFEVDFEETELGRYTREDHAAEWPEAEWTGGLADERGHIVEDPGGRDDQVLEVLYPADGYGPGDHGVQWEIAFDQSHRELYLQYRVRFQKGFEFVKGGKLPGLLGGEGNTGGEVPDGTDGWSGRMMWRRDGEVVQYVYHPDQSGTYGEDFEYELDGETVTFAPGTWHTVQHRIVMNTPGKHDGRMQAWFDGRLALDVTDLRFRDIPDFAVDGFYFSTFFGGGDDSWAPGSDMRIYFDDVVVARRRIPGSSK